MKNPKSGAYKKCLNKNCDSLVYLEKRFVDTNKCRACSKECRTQHISRLFSGKGNPMFGKKLTEQQLKKQKETLQKNYPGTLNAFSLSKKRKKTRPQIEIYNFLVEKYPDFNFQIEKRISQNETKVIFADIVSLDKKIVVEFNGDYWHCNPQKYDESFFHQVKKLKACEIWELDKKRIETINSLCYNIKIIWESNFRSNNWKNDLINFVESNEKKNNINDL